MDNIEDDEEWVDDNEPVYRSFGLSLGQAPFGAQQFGDGTFGGDSMMQGSMQTYDPNEEETPVYRSLAVGAPSNPHMGGFGGFGDMGHMHMGAHSMAQPKAAPAVAQQTNYPSVTLSAVPISTSFLDQCHVYARGDKDEIAFKVSEFMSEEGVDVEFKGKKAKWKCVHYDYGQHVDFRVRLYLSLDHNDVYPLEFQRRQGPVLQFNRLYQSIIYKLSQAGFLRDPVRQPSQPLVMPSFPAAAPQIIDEGVERLVDMAKSELEDVKHQALVSLSKLSPKSEYQQSLLRQSEAVEAFRACMSGSSHVRRCAVTIMADMCMSADGQKVVASSLGIAQGNQQPLQQLFSMAEGAGPTADVETQRQSCRLLARLANECHGEIIAAAQSNQSATQLLVSCDSQKDSRLRKHLAEIKDALRDHGVSI